MELRIPAANSNAGCGAKEISWAVHESGPLALLCRRRAFLRMLSAVIAGMLGAGTSGQGAMLASCWRRCVSCWLLGQMFSQ